LTAEEYNPVAGTAIKLVSLSGEVIMYIRNTDLSGESLKCRVEELKIGGVDKIIFTVDRQTTIPTFPGMEVQVWKDGALFAIGYSDTIPKSASTNPELSIICLGYQHKLKEQVINKTYASITLKNIIADLETLLAEVDIIYDSLLIDLPNVTVTELVFNDVTLYEALQSILKIANSNYASAQYRWFIDNGRKLNYALIASTPIRSLFEGFNYQFPEVEVDDQKVLNKVLAYKADSIDNKKLTYVASYEDTDSQGKYGIRDKIVVFPDEIDNASLQKIGEGLISKNKDPKTKVLIDNLEGTDYPFAFYKLSSRLSNYWQVMSECDSFDNWDLSGVSSTTVTLSEETVLTGRRAIKCVTGEGSFGESIQLDNPSPVYAPSIFRLFLNLEESMTLKITVRDSNGVGVSFELGKAQFNLEMDKTVTTVVNMEVDIPISEVSSGYGEGNYGELNYGE
jgi:hypothetical protein